jgi:hypothetical protein
MLKPVRALTNSASARPQLRALHADQCLHLALVDPAVARGDHQHRRVVALAPEDDALGDLAQRHTQGIGGLLRGAGCIVEQHRRVRMGARLQPRATRCVPSGQACGSATFGQHGIGHARTGLALQEVADVLPGVDQLSRSMPVSMPMPCSM